MKLTKDQKALFSKMGQRGGKARAANMTPKARKLQAQKAGRARWAKSKKTE